MKEVPCRAAVEQLVAELFWKIDRRDFACIPDLFTEDGRLIIPNLADGMKTTITAAGRDALAKQWAGRPLDLVSRHVFTNLHVHQISETEAEGRCIGLGFRHQGPGLGLPEPVIVNDQDDLYERGADGLWRFKEKRITVTFIAPELLGR